MLRRARLVALALVVALGGDAGRRATGCGGHEHDRRHEAGRAGADSARYAGTQAPADPNALVKPAVARPTAGRCTGSRAARRSRSPTGSPKFAARVAATPARIAAVYEKGPSRWQVSYYAARLEGGPSSKAGDAPKKEIAQVLIDDASGAVLEHWTGFQVAWTMARGYPGAFGRKVNCAVDMDSARAAVRRAVRRLAPAAALAEPRPAGAELVLGLDRVLQPRRHRHVGAACLSATRLPARTDAGGRRCGRRDDATAGGIRAPHVNVPVAWLAVAVVFLVGFRIGLNVASSNVIDVGYSGVIGADRLLHGKELYGRFPSDDERGDTYGPVAYEAYVPAVKLFGWSGRWDDLPAGHAAAIAFDLLVVALLFLLGRRARGPDLGIVLAYAWVTYPFTIFVSNSNTNDSLVTAIVLLALLAAVSRRRTSGALWSGATAALAGLTKFAPLALAPVLATHRLERGGGTRVRRLLWFGIGFVIAAAVVWLPFVGESLHTVYDRTIGYQSSRGSPFSIWGLYDWPQPQHVVQVAGAVLALALALVPRRRDLSGLAAACAAVLIALQLGVTHWFYLYLVWFFPLVMIALLCRQEQPAAAARSTSPAAALPHSAPVRP